MSKIQLMQQLFCIICIEFTSLKGT